MTFVHVHDTLTLIMFMPQIIQKEEQNPDTLASFNCIQESSLCEFLGVAFSLIVIMLQTSSCLCFGLSPFNIGVIRAESIIQVVPLFFNIQTIS